MAGVQIGEFVYSTRRGWCVWERERAGVVGERESERASKRENEREKRKKNMRVCRYAKQNHVCVQMCECTDV